MHSKTKNYGSYIKTTKFDAIRRTASSMATSIFHILKKSSELPGHGRSTISVFRQMMGRILPGNQNSEWRNSGICQLIGSIESYGFHSIRLSQIGTGDLIGIGIQESEKTRQIFPAKILVATNNHLPDKGCYFWKR